MLRIPDYIVEEARRLSVETGLRLYVVGGLAEYAAGLTNTPPKDHDLIVVGDRNSYLAYEHGLTVTDEDEDGDESYSIPVVKDGEPVTLSRTRYGGLRILVDGGPSVDVWHEYAVTDYLAKSDKGGAVVVDPVTDLVFRRIESPAEHADVLVDGKAAYHHSFPSRTGKGYYSAHVEPALRQKGLLKPGKHKIELRQGGETLREWEVDEPDAAPATPSAPAAEKKPETRSGHVRWSSHPVNNVPFTYDPAWDKDRLVAEALRTLAREGKQPVGGDLWVVVEGSTTTDYNVGSRVAAGAVQVWVVTGKDATQSFKVYLPKGDHLRSYKDGVLKAAKADPRFNGVQYVTGNLPGTYESVGWATVGQPGVVPKDVWAIRWGRTTDPKVSQVSDVKFEMPKDASFIDVSKEAIRTRRASGLLTLTGEPFTVWRLDEGGQPVPGSQYVIHA